jgi:hypothetical protein
MFHIAYACTFSGRTLRRSKCSIHASIPDTGRLNEHARAAVGSLECRGHATIQYLHTTPGSTLVATPRMSIASRVPDQEGGVLVWFHHLWPKEVRPFQWGGGGGQTLAEPDHHPEGILLRATPNSETEQR